MHVATLMLCLLQFQSDPARPGQYSPWDNPNIPVKNDMSAGAGLQGFQKKRFEEAFNKLVFAVEAFSIAYNQNKGQTWPSDKAGVLRKAMADLQKIDPNFKPGLLLEAKR